MCAAQERRLDLAWPTGSGAAALRSRAAGSCACVRVSACTGARQASPATSGARARAFLEPGVRDTPCVCVVSMSVWRVQRVLVCGHDAGGALASTGLPGLWLRPQGPKAAPWCSCKRLEGRARAATGSGACIRLLVVDVLTKTCRSLERGGKASPLAHLGLGTSRARVGGRRRVDVEVQRWLDIEV